MKKMIIILVLLSIIPIVFAQDQYLERDITPNMSMNTYNVISFDLFERLNFQQGDLKDLVKHDFNESMLVYKIFCDKTLPGFVSRPFDLTHRHNFSLMEGFLNRDLNLTSFNKGAQHSLFFWKRMNEINGRSGLSIIKSPDSPVLHPKTDTIDDSKSGIKDQDYKSSRSKRYINSAAVDIARNSGGKHGEGRLPTAYSESLSNIRSISPVIDITRNSGGKHCEGRLSTIHTQSLSERSTSTSINDIARNSGGRNGE